MAIARETISQMNFQLSNNCRYTSVVGTTSVPFKRHTQLNGDGIGIGNGII